MDFFVSHITLSWGIHECNVLGIRVAAEAFYFSCHLFCPLHFLTNSIFFHLPFLLNSREGTSTSSAFYVLLFSFFFLALMYTTLNLFVFLILCPQKMRVSICLCAMHMYIGYAHCASSLLNCIIWWEAEKFFGFNERVCVCECVLGTFHSSMFIFQSYSFYIWNQTKKKQQSSQKEHTSFVLILFVVLLFWPDFVQLIYSAHCLWYLPAL